MEPEIPVEPEVAAEAAKKEKKKKKEKKEKDKKEKAASSSRDNRRTPDTTVANMSRLFEAAVPADAKTDGEDAKTDGEDAKTDGEDAAPAAAAAVPVPADAPKPAEGSLVMKDKVHTVKQCDPYQGEPGFLRFADLGPELKNVKCREWIALRPAADEDTTVDVLFEAGLKAGKSVIAAQFADGPGIIVRKAYARGDQCIPAGFKAYAISDAKSVTSNVIAVLRHFLLDSAAFKANLHIADNTENYIMKLHEVLDALKEVKAHELKEWTAAAKRARDMGFIEEPHLKPLHKGILSQTEEVKEHFKSMSEAILNILRIDDRQTWQVNEQIWEDVDKKAKELIGYMWDIQQQKITKITLDEWINSPLHRNVAAILAGVGGSGKSQVMHAAAKTFCIRYKKLVYFFMKALDPLGILTRGGHTTRGGCFCFTDFDIATLMDSGLTVEELKGLFDVVEGGSYKARYHVATMPRKTPKMFAFNGEIKDFVEFFKTKGLPQIAAVFGEDAEALKKLSQTDQAVARRVAVFPVKDSIISKEAIKALQVADQQAVDEGRANEKEWIKQHRG